MSFPFIVTSQKSPYFPQNLPSDINGVVAIGGELNDDILIDAYSKGYFPWYESKPVVWYSPQLRLVLIPNEFKTTKRFLRFVKNTDLKISCDTRFDEVIDACANIPRLGQNGKTWINSEVLSAYKHFHLSGYAHSIEVCDGDSNLVGGLYGVSLGKCFFGESMFSLHSNASKLALYHLVQYTLERGFHFIDCQVTTDHLKSLGAKELPKKEFEERLNQALNHSPHLQNWTNVLNSK